MSVVIIFTAIIVAVFIGALITSRRFGALALGLAAGSVLSSLWSSWLAETLESMGLQTTWLPIGSLSVAVLLLAPVFLLLLNGPKYHSKYERIFSALFIGVLTAAFLVQPLGRLMVLDGDALEAYRWLSGVWQYVVTVGLVLGVIDLFLYHSSKTGGRKKKH